MLNVFNDSPYTQIKKYRGIKAADEEENVYMSFVENV